MNRRYETDGAQGGAAVDFFQKEQERVCLMRREMDNASRAHKDLLRKQNALQKHIDEMENDEGIIAKLNALKTQFKELISIEKDMKKKMSVLWIKILRELHTAMGETEKVAEKFQQKKGELPRKAHRSAPDDKVEELFIRNQMKMVRKLNIMATDELATLDEIGKKNAIALVQIKRLKRRATATVEGPDCRTM